LADSSTATSLANSNLNFADSGASYMTHITMLTLGFYIANFRTLPHLKLRATYPDIGLPRRLSTASCGNGFARRYLNFKFCWL